MSSQDLHNQIDERVAKATVAVVADTAIAGNIIDTKGYESLEFVLQAGIVSAGDVTPSLFDGDDSGLSDVAAVSAANTLGALVTLDATDGITRFGYVGKKRYVRVTLTGANSANLTAGVIAILSNPRTAPVAQ